MSLRDWLNTATVATVATDSSGNPASVAKVAGVASNEDSASDAREAIDPDVERRRDRALAMLAEQPDRRIAVVAEPGDPAHVAIAIRGAAVGELQIPSRRFDAFALLALLDMPQFSQ